MHSPHFNGRIIHVVITLLILCSKNDHDPVLDYLLYYECYNPCNYIIFVTLHEHCSGIWQQVPYVITHVVSGMYCEASITQLDRTGQMAMAGRLRDMERVWPKGTL